MNNSDLKSLSARNRAITNKPSEDVTYRDATVSSDVFQHASNERVTMDDIKVNSLIDEFANKYTEKWGSALNLKHREQKQDDIRDFMANNKLSIEDMKEYINWLFKGRLNKKFPGNLGCLHSQSMFDEWKGVEVLSVGTSEQQFKDLQQTALAKNAKMSQNLALFAQKATPEEKVAFEKYFSFEYYGADAMSWWRSTLAKCKTR